MNAIVNPKSRGRVTVATLYQQWQLQPQRERLSLSLLAGFLALAMLYSALWLPLQTRLKDARHWYQVQNELHQYMLSNQALAQKASVKSHVITSLESLQMLVTSTSQDAGLVIERYDFDSNGMRLNLLHVPFRNLLPWLTSLEKQGVHLVELNLTKATDGNVDAQMTLGAGQYASQ
ncbi:MAG: type II secretion system protein GspM [Gammaproteobacteria bacterium]